MDDNDDDDDDKILGYRPKDTLELDNEPGGQSALCVEVRTDGIPQFFKFKWEVITRVPRLTTRVRRLDERQRQL